MKNKLIVGSLLLIMLVCITGCGNSNTRVLKCSATNSQDGRETTSDLEVKVRDNEIKDMTLTLNIELSSKQQSYKQAMIYQLRQKTDRVYSTDKGIEAVFGMGSSYFNTLGITKDVSYGELKQVLELQGYTCEE